MECRQKVYASLIAVLLMSGCAANGPEKEDFASSLIAEKTAIAAAAQRDYVALLSEDYSTLQKRWLSFDKDTIDLDFIGNPKELIQTIASRYGMSFSEVGRPVEFRQINIRMSGVKPDDALRNIGNQINAAADIVFNRTSHSITIEYKKRDNYEQPAGTEIRGS